MESEPYQNSMLEGKMSNWVRCDECGRPMPVGITVSPNICGECGMKKLSKLDVERFVKKNKKLMEKLGKT